METHDHSLPVLFDQLGLDSSDAAIQQFIRHHTPVPEHLELHAASFWSEAQAGFLRQAKEEDADWAEVVDQLNVMLRARH